MVRYMGTSKPLHGQYEEGREYVDLGLEEALALTTEGQGWEDARSEWI
jgi:hypothetical protein